MKMDELYEESDRIKELKQDLYIVSPENARNIVKSPGDVIQEMYLNKDYWNNRKVLITGISGFVGSHLAGFLINRGARVYGIVRRHSDNSYENLKGIEDDITLYQGDITSYKRMRELFNHIRPWNVFHLAAESFVPTSFREPARVINTNAAGTINILEAARNLKYEDPVVSVAGSSEEYGLVEPEEVPITEDQPFRPRSVYGISKIATEHAAKHYNEAYGLKTLISRAFNHEGPRRGEQFVTTVIHKQILECRYSMKDHIEIGNPNAVRDFTHVYDMVRAYCMLHEYGKYGEPYNICSGYGITIGDYVRLAKELYDVDAPVYISENRMRPSDVPILIGDSRKFRRDTLWRRKLSIFDIIKDGYEYLENQLI